MRHWFRVHTVVVVYFPVLASADDVEKFFGDYTRAILCVDSWFRVDLGIVLIGDVQSGMEPCCAFVLTCVGVFWLVPLLPLGFFGVSCATCVVCVFWVPDCFVLCLGLLVFDLMWNRVALLFRLRLCCVVLFLWVFVDDVLLVFCFRCSSSTQGFVL